MNLQEVHISPCQLAHLSSLLKAPDEDDFFFFAQSGGLFSSLHLDLVEVTELNAHYIPDLEREGGTTTQS